jgi:hypothetical protein
MRTSNGRVIGLLLLLGLAWFGLPSQASAVCAMGNQDKNLPVELCATLGGAVNQVLIDFTVANKAKTTQTVIVTVAIDGKNVLSTTISLKPGTSSIVKKTANLSKGTHVITGTAAASTSTARSTATVTITVL